MFEGRRYKQAGGFADRAVRFSDKDGGVCTTTYNYSMTDEEKWQMARRITAALNYTSNLTTDQMERSEPLRRSQ